MFPVACSANRGAAFRRTGRATRRAQSSQTDERASGWRAHLRTATKCCGFKLPLLKKGYSTNSRASNLPRRPRRKREASVQEEVVVGAGRLICSVPFCVIFFVLYVGGSWLKKKSGTRHQFQSDYLSKTQGRTERSSALSSHTHTAKVRTPFLPTVAITLSKGGTKPLSKLVTFIQRTRLAPPEANTSLK